MSICEQRGYHSVVTANTVYADLPVGSCLNCGAQVRDIKPPDPTLYMTGKAIGRVCSFSVVNMSAAVDMAKEWAEAEQDMHFTIWEQEMHL